MCLSQSERQESGKIAIKRAEERKRDEKKTRGASVSLLGPWDPGSD